MTDAGENENRYQTECIICLDTAEEAVVTTCCVDIMCNACYQKLIGKDCPKCREKKFKANPQLFVRKFILQTSPEIQFLVQIFPQGTILLRMRKMETLKMLFNRVQERTGIPIQKMYLSFQGKNLYSTEESLNKYGITNQSTIHQLSRLKGG